MSMSINCKYKLFVEEKQSCWKTMSVGPVMTLRIACVSHTKTTSVSPVMTPSLRIACGSHTKTTSVGPVMTPSLRIACDSHM